MNMDDGLTSIIAEQADRQFRDLLTRDALDAASAGRWQQGLWDSVEGSGLALALVPEDQGGVGLEAKDAFGLVRLAGYRALPMPLADTLIARALWSTAGGDIDALMTRPVLLASQPSGTPFSLQKCDSGWQINGKTAPLRYVDAGADLLLQAQSDDGRMFLVLINADGLTRERRAGPALEVQRMVRLQGTEVPGERCLPWHAGDPLAMMAHGALVRSLEMVGAMQRALEMGLQYAAERSQFGKPIGRFAPVQDMLVEAAAETSASVAAVSLAVQHWSAQINEDAIFCIAAAKARCGEAAGKVSALIHQVHGAIGFTQEHLLHQSTRRLWGWRDEFGSEAFWTRWLGERICASPGQSLWARIASL